MHKDLQIRSKQALFIQSITLSTEQNMVTGSSYLSNASDLISNYLPAALRMMHFLSSLLLYSRYLRKVPHRILYCNDESRTDISALSALLYLPTFRTAYGHRPVKSTCETRMLTLNVALRHSLPQVAGADSS